MTGSNKIYQSKFENISPQTIKDRIEEILLNSSEIIATQFDTAGGETVYTQILELMGTSSDVTS